MKWSISFGRVAGIRILMHWTFLLLLAWIVISELNRGSNTTTILLTVAYVLCIFLCVILHEFGHALTARRFGVHTRKITLLPIGGLASMERIPEKPQQELLVAVAGPAVNVLIAGVLLLIGSFSFRDLFVTENIETLGSITRENFLYALCLINIILVVFNAIPAFPMDGGRVLRALLSFFMKRTTATNFAAKLGQIIGVIFILMGFFGNILLVLIGVFVMAGAYSENMMVQQVELLKGHKIKEAMMTKFTLLSPEDSVQTAVDKLLDGSENNFLVASNGQIKGVLKKEHIIGALKNKQNNIQVSQIMNSEVTGFNSEDPLNDAFIKLQRDKKRQQLYPVHENGKLAGVLDMENLQEFLMTRFAAEN